MLAVIFLLALRLVLLPVAVLIPEETYYWMYTKFPALGYLDHPPMVAWLIGTGTRLFGDNEFGVRIFNWLFTVGSTWLSYLLGSVWHGRRAGITAALLFNLVPLFCGTGFVVTPDAALLFFWLFTLVAVTHAYRTGQTHWWLMAGLGTGLGFLSKYPAAFLAISTFVFLLTDARGRRMLTRPGPWLAVAAALIAAFPVILWNFQNNWESFRFQFSRRAAEQVSFSPLKTLEWLGAQFFLLTPLVFALFTAAWWIALRRFRKDRKGCWRFAACFFLPWLAMCFWHGLFVTVNINWPLPAYLALIPAAVPLMRMPLAAYHKWARTSRRALIRRYATALAALDAVVLLFVSIQIPWLPRPKIFTAWNRLGHAAEVVEDEMSQQAGVEPMIISDGKYKLASELAFYMRDWPISEDWKDVIPASAAFGEGLSYDNWHQLDKMLGRHALFITSEMSPRVMELLRLGFAHVDEPTQFFEQPLGFGKSEQYWAVRCWDYRGIDPAAVELLPLSKTSKPN